MMRFTADAEKGKQMKLIDADALIKEMAKIEDLRTLSTKTIGEAIDRVPGIEIIHCKDCKHGAFDAWVKTYWCKGKQHLADWFCADGERKEQ